MPCGATPTSATGLDAPSRSCQPANPRCRLVRTKELLRFRRPCPMLSIDGGYLR